MLYVVLLSISWSLWGMESTQMQPLSSSTPSDGQIQPAISLTELKKDRVQLCRAQSSFIEAFLVNKITACVEEVKFPDYESTDLYVSPLGDIQILFTELMERANTTPSPRFCLTPDTNPRHRLTLIKELDEEDTLFIQLYRFCRHIALCYTVRAQLSNPAASETLLKQYTHLGATLEHIREKLDRCCQAIECLKHGIEHGQVEEINHAHSLGYSVFYYKKPITFQEYVNNWAAKLEDMIAHEEPRNYQSRLEEYLPRHRRQPRQQYLVFTEETRAIEPPLCLIS